MNIPNMINTLISEAFEIKPALSPKSSEIPKSPNSKAKLRNFVLPGHFQLKREATSPCSKSISHHKLSREYTQKDLVSAKNNQSLDQAAHNKTFEAKKETKRSSNIVLASFLKNHPLKQNITGSASKQPPVETVILDLKTSTVKNPPRNSPYQKRASPVPNKEFKLHSESVTQLHSPKGRGGDFYGHAFSDNQRLLAGESPVLKNKFASGAVSHKASNQPAQENEISIKKMSPKRLKAKEDRSAIYEVPYDDKRHFKRKSVYRSSRQNSNYTETMDDHSSKLLSTNAPSQFSEARKSIPSQKSQSMIKQGHHENTSINDEIKDVTSTSRQKTRHNTEIKFNESYDTGNHSVKTKQPSIKEKSQNREKAENNKSNNNTKQAMRNDVRGPKSMDGVTYGKFLKTFYMQKKSDLRKSTISKVTSSHVSFLKEDGQLGNFYKEQIKNLFKNNCDMKGSRERPGSGLRLETKVSEPRSMMMNTSSTRNILISPKGQELDSDLLYDMKRMTTKNNNSESHLRKELRKTKSLSPPKMKIYSEGGVLQGILGPSYADSGTKNVEVSVRSILKDERRETLGHNEMKEKESAESLKECSLHTSTYDVKTESNLSLNMNERSDALYRIYQKTKDVLQSYKVKENHWTNEKSLLLEHIKNLENKLKVYEN